MTALAGEVIVEPIGAAERAIVIAATDEWIARAGRLFERDFASLPVLFDLRGRAAGMYRVKARQRVIRYNPWLFAKYPEDNLAVTVPHEVAHYVTDCLYGLRRVRPHGVEWRAVMRRFGVDPRAGTMHDLAGIPRRTQRRHTYHCGCMTHELTSYRHRRIMAGRGHYVCRRCGGRLAVGQPVLASSSSQRA